MRRELVEEVLAAAAAEMFEDVIYTPAGGSPIVVLRAIFGVEPVDERFEILGERLRVGSHTTRALKALLPGLSKGAQINDGVDTYKVLDFEAVGDGRYEVMIALQKVG